MMSFSSSIRSKVWLCVAIALIGYFAATVVGFYVNITQYQRLAHLQLAHLPLVTLSDRLLNLYERQAEEFEDAFVIGESELATDAAGYTEKVFALLDTLLLEVAGHEKSPVATFDLHRLKEDYQQYIDYADQMQASLKLDTFSVESQKAVQQLGQTQQQLQARFQKLAEIFNASLTREIEQHKSKALYSMVFLAALFMVVLLLVALFVGRVSSRLLVSPLSTIQRNVERFERGVEPQQPPKVDPRDEIGQLAQAFWNMTERLTRTTVSKRYVDNIISNMSGALVVLRPDLVIDKVNQQTLKLFECSEAELIGQPLNQLIEAGDDPLVCRERIANLMHGQVIRDVDSCVVDKAGNKIPVHFSGSAMFDDNGEVAGIICVFNDITELKEAEHKLKQLAHHDPLTGLPNRNLFFDRLERSLLDGKRHGRIFALLYLDLDKFKPINDTLGHDFGDLALKEVSNRLLAVLRGDDTVARVGGDEFIIILNGLSHPDLAYTLARKVLDTVAAPLTLGSLSHQLGVSVGVSVFPQDGTSMDTLIAKADAAMYRAKNSGGNAYCGTITDVVGCDS